MRRVTEYVLAAIGAGVCIGGAMVFAQGQGVLWPMPALVLIETALLGLAGLITVGFDSGEHTSQWGIATWAVCGGLAAIMIIGAWTIGPLLLFAVVAFAIAALLADRRRGRNVLSNAWVGVVGAAANAVLLFLFILGTRA